MPIQISRKPVRNNIPRLIDFVNELCASLKKIQSGNYCVRRLRKGCRQRHYLQRYPERHYFSTVSIQHTTKGIKNATVEHLRCKYGRVWNAQ